MKKRARNNKAIIIFSIISVLIMFIIYSSVTFLLFSSITGYSIANDSLESNISISKETQLSNINISNSSSIASLQESNISISKETQLTNMDISNSSSTASLPESNVSILKEVQLSNITLSNSSLVILASESSTVDETLKQSTIVINQPVKWLKIIKINKSETLDITTEIPIDSTNISISTGKQAKKLEKEFEDYNKKVKKEERKKIKTMKITGHVVSNRTFSLGFIKKITSFFQSLTMTGQVIDESTLKQSGKLKENQNKKGKQNKKEIDLTEIIEIETTEEVEVVIEYYTQAPQSHEEKVSNKQKNIRVFAPEELNYENILAYTTLEKQVKESQIKLYHKKNNERVSTEIISYDLDNNGLVDYIEWIVPNLLDQNYELIVEISSAEHLDENKNFLADIYDQVSTLDGTFSPVIQSNEFVTVQFESLLDSTRDITVYARSNQTASIEIYEKDGNTIIQTIENISEFKQYKVYLDNLVGEQDSFDLRIIGAPVEFDLIIDPITFDDTVATGSTPDLWDTEMSWDHDITCGNDMVLIVGISIDSEPTVTVDAITYNGDSLTLVQRDEDALPDVSAEMWNLSDPDCGAAYEVLVTFTADSAEEAAGVSAVYYGVDSLNLSSATSVGGDYGSSSSLDVNSSSADNWVVNVFGLDRDPGASISISGDDATQRGYSDEGSTTAAIADGYDNDGTVRMGWSGFSDTWVQIGVELIPVPARINILSPTASIFNYTTFNLTYTAAESGTLDKCWYSNGTTNSSVVSVGTNWTSLTANEGENNWTVYCNDTSNDIESDLVTFTVDTSVKAELVQDTSNTDNGAAIACTLSSSATFGNLIVTAIATDKDSINYTVPTGFTLIEDYAGASVSGAMAYKVSTGGETAITWTQGSTTQDTVCWVGEYSGLETSGVFDVSSEGIEDSSGVSSISTGTTSVTSQANELAIAMFGVDTYSNTADRAWSNDFTEIDFTYNGNPGLAIAYKDLISVGTVETTASWTGSDQTYAILATFKLTAIGPVSVNIDSPTSSTYNYTTFDLNYTASATGTLDKCWYNNGVTNSSPVSAGTNWTSLTANEDSNNWTVYCNDTESNINSDIVVFTVDTSTKATKIQEITNYHTIAQTVLNCTLSSGASPGNLIVTAIGSDKGVGSYTIPSGFTLIDDYAGSSVSGAMAYKVSTGGETTITWTQGSDKAAACWVGEFSGLESSSVLDVSTENAEDGVAVYYISTGTTSSTTQDDELAIAMFALDSSDNAGGSSRSWSNDFTELQYINPGSGGEPGLGIAYKNLGSIGTLETTADWSSQTSDQAYASIATFKVASASSVNLTISSPTSTNYTTNTLDINYTASASGTLDKCWYFNGSVNSAPVSAGTNWSSQTAAQGSNVWAVYCNNTNGDEGSDSVSFYVDTIFPVISVNSPTPPNDTTSINTSYDFNFTITETNFANLTFNWNSTNYTCTKTNCDNLFVSYNTTDLKLGMSFDNSSDYSDWSGNNDAATNTGSSWSSDGVFGGALNLSGESDYITVSNDPDLQLIGDMTISFWMYPFQVESIDQSVLHKHYGNEFSIKNVGTGRIVYYHGNDSAYEYFDSTSSNFLANEWVYVTIIREVFDNGTTEKIVFYFNGEFDTADLSVDHQIPVASTNDLIIGDGYADNFDGYLDELLIYNRSLSQSEITELYEKGLNQVNSITYNLAFPFTGLSIYDYQYELFAVDDFDNQDSTGTRTLNVVECTETADCTGIDTCSDNECVGSTPPTITISDYSGYTNESVSVGFTVADEGTGIDTVWINDTTNFEISGSTIINKTVLSVGTYWLNISANDSVGEITSEIFYVQINLLPGQITSCQTLNTANKEYTLINNVSSTTTCFTITADNVTLDCQGYKINYSTGGTTSYGVLSNGYNGLIIQNCLIYEGEEDTVDKNAIYLLNSKDHSIFNNILITGKGQGIKYSSINNSNITQNMINSSNAWGLGIYFITSENNSVTYNNITTTGSDASGFYLSDSSLNDLSYNFINTSGSDALGFYFITSENNSATYNNITTSGSDASGFYLSDSLLSDISYNTIEINGGSSHGVSLGGVSINNNITFNQIVTQGLDWTQGILTDDSSSNNLIYQNNITTNCTGGNSYGVYIATDNNNITSNNITTLENYGDGIYIDSGDNNSFTYNNITTDGSWAEAFELEGSESNDISYNTIETNGGGGHGISLGTASINNNLTHNQIVTQGLDWAYGIELGDDANDGSINNFIYQNNITTDSTGGYSYGIVISTNNNNISSNNVTTLKAEAHGIYIDEANNTILINNLIYTSGADSEGVYIKEGFSTLQITNTTINSSDSGAYDFYIKSSVIDGEWNLTNVTQIDGSDISVYYDASASGTLNKHWYLSAYINDTNSNDLEDANVTIRDESDSILKTELTNSLGKITSMAVLGSIQNETNTYYKDYNITATKNGYSSETDLFNVTNNLEKNLELTEGAVGLTSCQTLDSVNTEYILLNNVSSAETCFTITADNVTLDCQGYKINYSGGYGVSSDGYDNLIIKNCLIYEYEEEVYDEFAIYLSESNNSLVKNNSLVTGHGPAMYYSVVTNTNITDNIIHSSDTWGVGMYIMYSDENYIAYNNITTTSSSSMGIYTYDSSLNNITYNNITTTSSSSDGIYLDVSFLNDLSYNNITTIGGSSGGLYLDDSPNNTFSFFNIFDTGGNGLELQNSLNNTFSVFNFSNIGWKGLYLGDSSNNIFSSFYIFDTVSNSFYLGNSSDNTFSSFDISFSAYKGLDIDIFSSNNTFSLFNISNIVEDGIKLDNHSSDNTFSFFNIFNVSSSGILLEDSSDNNTFSHFNISDAYYSFYLYSSGNNNLSFFDISDITDDGFYFVSSDNNTLSSFNISEVNNDAFEISASNNNIFFDFNISDSAFGPYLLDESSNNNFSSFNIFRIDGVCFDITNSSNNTFSSFNISDGGNNGLYLGDSSSNNTFSSFNISDVDEDGLYLDLSEENNFSYFNISNAGESGIQLQGSSDNNIFSDFNISNIYYEGIYLDSSNNNTFSSFNISSISDDGIQLDSSDNNTFSSFNISDIDYEGIYLEYSGNNTFSSFNISSIGDDGVQLDYSENNNFSSFNISDTGHHGIYSESSSDNTFSFSNISNVDNYGFYLAQSDDNILSSFNISNTGDDGIYFTSSDNNILSSFKIYNASVDGFYLSSSNNNTFSSFNISFNGDDGFELSSSDNNTFSYFNIFDGAYGPYFLDASSNNILSYFNIFNITNEGMWFDEAYNNTLSHFNISDIDNYAIAIDDNSTFSMFNFTLDAVGGAYDFYTSATAESSIWNLTNVTQADGSDISVDYNPSMTGSVLNKHWYLLAYINDTSSNDLENANVTIRNDADEILKTELTSSLGKITSMIVLGSTQNETDIYYKDYNITATKTDYETSSEIFNVTNNLEKNLELTPGAINLTSCQTLDTANQEYLLTQNVSSTETCFNITADNVTLDCQGYKINYSTDGTTGYGVFSNGYDNLTIKNCLINEGSSSGNDNHGFKLENVDSSLIYNNTISTFNADADGMYIADSDYNNFSNNNILANDDGNSISNSDHNTFSYNNISSTYGYYISSTSTNNSIIYNNVSTSADAIYLEDITNNDISYNNINTSGSGEAIVFSNSPSNNATNNNIHTSTSSYAYGIILNSNDHNCVIFNNNITTHGSYGHGIYVLSDENNISNNNILTTQLGSMGILLDDSKNNNFTSNNINITGASSNGYILYNSDNNRIINDKIYTSNDYSRGLYVYSGSSNLTMYNSTLNALGTADFEVLIESLASNGEWNLTNVTKADGSDISLYYNPSATGTLNKHWYLSAYINDTNSNDLENANVTIRDESDSILKTELTNSLGKITSMTVLGSIQNETDVYYKDYNITATKDGYSSETDVFNVTNNLEKNLELSVYSPFTIEFVEPTPENDSKTMNTTIIFNTTITNLNLMNATFNWNGTNYTCTEDYCDSSEIIDKGDERIVLGLSFDNSTDLSDWSGYDQTIINWETEWNTTGKFGGARVFSDDALEISDDTSLNLESFTISMWVYNRDYTYPRGFVTLKKSNTNCGAGVGGNGWAFGAANSDDAILICVNNGTDYVEDYVWLDTGSRPIDIKDTWAHLAYIVNRNTGDVTIFVNGIKQTNSLDISSLTGSIDNSGNIIFGNNWGWKIDGTLDEIIFYNEALNDSEILKDYHTGLNKLSNTSWYFQVEKSNLPVNDYIFQTFAIDNESNTNSTELRTLNVIECIEDSDCESSYVCTDNVCTDITAPIITVSDYSGYNNESVSIAFSSSDGLGVGIDTTWINDTTNFEISGSDIINKTAITEGIYSINLSSNDTVGNIASEIITVTINLSDLENPTVELVSPANEAINLTTNTIIFNYNVTDDNNLDNCSLIINSSIYNTTENPTKDTTLSFTRTLENDFYLWKVTCYDEAGKIATSEERELTVYNIGSYAIYLSPNLSSSITWDVATIPSYNLSAPSNNGESATGYYINISVENGGIDLYIRGDKNLMTADLDVLNITYEKFSYNSTNSTVPDINKFSLTTNYADNKIGENLQNDTAIFLKFFLDVPPAQAVGIYNNSLEIKAIPYGSQI